MTRKWITGISIFPIALPASYIAKQYRKERTWWGRILNNVEYWLIRRLLK